MKTEGPCRAGAHTLQNDPEGTPSNILETKFRLGAGGLGHTHPPISPQWSSHSLTITASAEKSMVLPASASPPFGNACCWAAGQRLWIVSGWREATASWRASPPCMQGLQGKAGAAEAQCLPGLHSGCPPYLIGGPTPQCLGLNDSRCVKHLRGSIKLQHPSSQRWSFSPVLTEEGARKRLSKTPCDRSHTSPELRSAFTGGKPSTGLTSPPSPLHSRLPMPPSLALQ